MLLIHIVHLIAAGLLLGLAASDAFFLSSRNSVLFSPSELLIKMKKRLTLLQMFLFSCILIAGLLMWLPSQRYYSPVLFHSKIFFSFVYLILSKVRLFKERKQGVAHPVLAKILFLLLLLIFTLGALAGLGISL